MDFRTDPQFDDITSSLEASRGLPPGLLRSIVSTESGGDPKADSGKAKGLTQFTPATAQQYNVNVNDPVDSMRGTADYMQDLIHQYGGNVNAALAHYNGGGHNAHAVLTTGQPTSPETVQYVQKVTAGLPAATTPEQVNTFVATLAQQGQSNAQIYSALLKNPATAPLAKQGVASGDDLSSVINTLGGQPLQDVKAKLGAIDAQGFGTNLVKGAGNAVDDLGNAASQLVSRVTGNDASLQKFQNEQKAKETDPYYQRQQGTGGSIVGSAGVKAIPYVVAGALAPEGVIPAVISQAGAGAVDGALTPTTDKGQILHNILGSTAAGGVTAGVGGGLAKLGGKVLGATGDRLVQAGVAPVDQAAVQREFAQAVGSKIGVPDATRIDSDLISSADAVHKPLFEQAAAGNTVTIPTGFASDMQGLTDNITHVPKPLTNMMNRLSEGDTIPAETWIRYRSDIGAAARSAEGADKKYLGDIVSKLDDTLSTSSSLSKEQLDNLAQARQIYRNLQPVEAMVAKSGNTGVVTPQNALAAVRSNAGTDAYSRGAAPLQDETDAFVKKLGKGNVFDKIAANTGNTDSDFATYMGAEALGHIIPHIQPVVIGGKLAAKVLNTNAGRAAATNTGTALQGAGHSLASNPELAAVLANLLRKGVGQ